MSDGSAEVNRLVDKMLAAQSRFAVTWRDDLPLTEQQGRDAAQRDEARSILLSLMSGRIDREDRLRAELAASAEDHSRSAEQFALYVEMTNARVFPNAPGIEAHTHRCAAAAKRATEAAG